MSNPLTYSRNDDFDSLEDPPNTPQSATLKQEIADSACEAVVAYISTNEVGWPPTDIEVAIYFETEPSAQDEAVVDAVVEAHKGIPTTGEAQYKDEVGESSTTSTSWTDKIDATAKPVQAGIYQVCATCETRTTDEDEGLFAECRLTMDGDQIAFSACNQSRYHDFSLVAMKELKEGYAPQFKLQFRTSSGDHAAYIRNAKICVTKVQNQAIEMD